MKNIYILLIMLLGALTQISAQQDHQYTQFMYNKLLINPGYAGARGVPFITGAYRSQWVGFDGAPKSALLSFNSPFLSQRVGAGITISHQEAGLQRDFFGSAAYAYDLVPGDLVSIRAGLQASVRSLGINFADAKTGDPGGPNADPSLQNKNISNVYANVGAGVYATYDNRVFAGFSIPRMYVNSWGINPDPAINSAMESRHYYFMGGGVVTVNKDIKLLPSVLAKYVYGAPFDADFNVSLEMKEKISVGFSYRIGGDASGESLDLLAYWQATPLIGIGAAYDFTLSKLKNYTAGSFEVLLQADLKQQKKSRRNMSNPRFFL